MTTSPYILPKLIAHRGASAYAPENTLISFKKAHELGAKWVEFDVVLTRDEVPIIFHDEKTTRTTDQPDLIISDLTLKEVKRLDAGRWFAPEFTGEAIPTLEEVLLWMKQYQMMANIEIKPAPKQEAKTTVKTLELLKKHWTHAPYPLISSFKEESLLAAREFDSHLPLTLIKHKWETDHLNLLNSLSCKSVSLDYRYITDGTVIATIKKLGFGVMCYTVNESPFAQQLFDWGVDGIFTNYPDLLSESTH